MDNAALGHLAFLATGASHVQPTRLRDPSLGFHQAISAAPPRPKSGSVVFASAVAVSFAGALRQKRRRHTRAGLRVQDTSVADVETSNSVVVAAPTVQSRKVGIILQNIGTPASTDVDDVREYLSRFLGDDRVLDIKPSLLKWAVLQIVLATRPQNAREAYASIWDSDRGSPLFYHSQDLAEALERTLGGEFKVRVGMQYSEPTVKTAMRELTSMGYDNILLLPAFPHYASSTTGTCLENAYKNAAEMYCTPYISVVPPFFDDANYLSAMKHVISSKIGLGATDVDHVLFSFHGLPENQCSQTDPTGSVCMVAPGCCKKLVQANRNCYRAQCFESARILAQELGIEEDRWTIGFQSRLTLRGSIKWIKPYTDEIFEDLAKRGVRRLAVVAPSFTADCVETLEELGIQGTEQFVEAGGEELVVVPCLNCEDVWVDALAQIVRNQLLIQPQGQAALEEVAALGTADQG